MLLTERRERLLPEACSYLLQLPHGPATKCAGGSGKVTVAAKGFWDLTPVLTESSPLSRLGQNKQRSHRPFTGLLQETL